MRSVTSKWFEVKFRYEKTTENGQQKKVTEAYAVDALSWSEAEKRITEEMAAYVSGESEIRDIRPAAYGEVFFSDNESDDKYYKTKLAFITIDEKTEKEKRQNVVYLVQASSTAQAEKYVHEVMGTTMIDYSVLKVEETKIMDVFVYGHGNNEVKAEKE